MRFLVVVRFFKTDSPVIGLGILSTPTRVRAREKSPVPRSAIRGKPRAWARLVSIRRPTALTAFSRTSASRSAVSRINAPGCGRTRSFMDAELFVTCSNLGYRTSGPAIYLLSLGIKRVSSRKPSREALWASRRTRPGTSNIASAQVRSLGRWKSARSTSGPPRHNLAAF